MLFKNKVMQVKMVEENPNAMAMKPINPPHRPNYLYELGVLIDMNIAKVAKIAITYKAATTLLRAAEHVVVTRIK